MKSNTPISDAVWDFAWDEGGCHEEHLLDVIKKLELELNEANEQIKILRLAINQEREWVHHDYEKLRDLATELIKIVR